MFLFLPIVSQTSLHLNIINVNQDYKNSKTQVCTEKNKSAQEIISFISLLLQGPRIINFNIA